MKEKVFNGAYALTMVFAAVVIAWNIVEDNRLYAEQMAAEAHKAPQKLAVTVASAE